MTSEYSSQNHNVLGLMYNKNAQSIHFKLRAIEGAIRCSSFSDLMRCSVELTCCAAVVTFNVCQDLADRNHLPRNRDDTENKTEQK